MKTKKKVYTGPKMDLAVRLGGVPRRDSRGTESVYSVKMARLNGSVVFLARCPREEAVLSGHSFGEVAWYAAYNAEAGANTVITVAVERL